MTTSCNENVFHVSVPLRNPPVTGGFYTHRANGLWCFRWCQTEQTVEQKQSNCWWFETLIRRHCNVPMCVGSGSSWYHGYHCIMYARSLTYIETNQWTSSPQAVYAPRPTSCWYRSYTCRGRSLISLRYLIKVRIIFRSLTCMESNASTLLITGVTLCFPVLYVLLNITIILAYTGKWYRGYPCWSDWE